MNWPSPVSREAVPSLKRRPPEVTALLVPALAPANAVDRFPRLAVPGALPVPILAYPDIGLPLLETGLMI